MKNRYLKALNRIQAIVDAYKNNQIHITVGNDDFDKETHTYDVSAVMGIIGNYIADALCDDESERRVKL
ncbi:MAG: hypothetical protein IJE43_13715 [Alphaproteobacteria bacterium]|nr:hypothetical protein [Alphaproteobacteria bacterium]